MTSLVAGFAPKRIRQQHFVRLYGVSAAYCYIGFVACACSITRNINAKATTLVGAIAIGLGVGTLSAFAGGSFDPNLPRGISMSKFSVPGQSIQETCIVPSTFLLLSTGRPMRIENMSCANIIFMSLLVPQTRRAP